MVDLVWPVKYKIGFVIIKLATLWFVKGSSLVLIITCCCGEWTLLHVESNSDFMDKILQDLGMCRCRQVKP